uniref:unspecific monooxygenase n=1 Tax=Sphenodon punctatus TaxID=8508 RepID=A0A8D0H4X8_SPHPU
MEPLGATTILLVICISCLLLSAWRKMSGNGKLPPGPVPLPLIGNALQLNTKNLPQSIEKLSAKFGPVFTIYLGTKPAVVLYGYEAVKEALIDQGDAFSGRGPIPILDQVVEGKGEWLIVSVNRTDALTGKYRTGRRKGEMARILFPVIKTEKGAFDPTSFLIHAVSNVICSVVFGDRFDYHDKKFLKLIDLLEQNSKLQLSFTMYLLFPTLMDYFPGPHKKILKNFRAFASFVSERTKINRESLDLSCPRDFIDAFLIKIEEEKQNDQSEFNNANMVKTTLDLFIAGTGTTSITLKYGLLLLLRHPEIEAKVHEEIDRVIGRNRRPCMADRSQMPYTDAVVHEIQRFVSLVPLNVPRTVIRDTQFRQFIIPKGTIIFPTLKSILYDSREFPNPDQFDPGHFLDENGAFRKTDYFMPFSTGKRICAGEGMARMEIFLFLTMILQNFTLKPLIDPKEIDISPITTTMANRPRPFQLCVVPR